MSTNTTTNATIPNGWTKVAWPFGSDQNVTKMTMGGDTVTMDNTRFNRNILSAWTSANRGQIDDVVGVQKATGSLLGMPFTTFNPVQNVQFALSGSLATGSQIASWITYSNWANLNVQTLTSIGTTTTNTVSFSNNGDIAALTGVTASNTRGTTAVTNTSSIAVTATSTHSTAVSGWFTITTLAEGTEAGQLKVGDSLTYTTGYKVFATSTATTPTALASGSGKFTVVDTASILSLSACVSAAIAMIAF